MKRLLFVIFFAVNIFFSLSAQNEQEDFNRNQWKIGVGLANTNDIVSAISDVLLVGFSGGIATTENKTFSGSYYLGYKYAFSKRLSLGGTFVYNKNSFDLMAEGDKVGHYKNNYYTIAPELDFTYLNMSVLSLYGSVGAGITLNNQTYIKDGTNNKEKASAAHFNFQFSPIGLKIGHNAGGFLEAGFGYKGIINLGFFANL